jgi:hypothetical protein
LKKKFKKSENLCVFFSFFHLFAIFPQGGGSLPLAPKSSLLLSPAARSLAAVLSATPSPRGSAPKTPHPFSGQKLITIIHFNLNSINKFIKIKLSV